MCAAMEYALVCKVDAHERIINGGAWSPDDRLFATGGRDKKVKLWTATGESVATLLFDEAVTSVAWYACRTKEMRCAHGTGGRLGFGMCLQSVVRADC